MSDWIRNAMRELPCGGPTPKSKSTRYRVKGPVMRNGFNTWEVWDLHEMKMMGDPVFSMEHAGKRVKDLVSGKTRFFVGNIAFHRNSLA